MFDNTIWEKKKKKKHTQVLKLKNKATPAWGGLKLGLLESSIEPRSLGRHAAKRVVLTKSKHNTAALQTQNAYT